MDDLDNVPLIALGMLPGKVKGFGGALDLVSNPEKTKVVVTMEHTDRKGNPKIVKQCTFPLTGKACVSMIITDLVRCAVLMLTESMLISQQGVFEVDWKHGLTLTEIADGVTIDEIRTKTDAPFKVADNLKSM